MKIKLAVLFGGKSVEHEISIISAIQAINYLDTDKYEIIPVYITKDNQMYVGDGVGEIESYTNLAQLLKRSQRVVMIYDGNRTALVKYPMKRFSKNLLSYIDVAFPIVHGTNVEDGSLQGYLKTLGLPFVGCDVLSSAVGMDKYVMKTVLKDNNIPVLDCLVFGAAEYDEDPENAMDRIEDRIGYPLIVKPINLGSSIGISKAKDRPSLEEALETAFSFADRILVESAVQNLKEINCSVLGDADHAEASECEEPVNSDEILSFEDKYIGDRGGGSKGAKGGAKGGSKGGSKGMATLKRKIPAEITPEQRETIRKYAVDAFKCLGCCGVSRIDFMMNSETGQIWLNEINTIPGSLSFYLWEPTGVPYKELLDRMIALALKRQRTQEGITYKFDSNVLEGVSFGGGGKGAKGAKGSKL
ncbi:MAG: D-alanine--D-alanine ligase [Clostridia bacterium]|nr:D-alanine--D-alanine ligase [Clostridia bacterium]